MSSSAKLTVMLYSIYTDDGTYLDVQALLNSDRAYKTHPIKL